jgi:hypothetical protein
VVFVCPGCAAKVVTPKVYALPTVTCGVCATEFPYAAEYRAPDDAQMEMRRVNYGAWLLRLLTWDGLLPAIVILTPEIAKQIMPHRPQAIEFISCIAPIAAFILRLFVAGRHLYSNDCTDQMRDRQFAFLCYAVMALLVIDIYVLLARDLPAGAMFANTFNLILWTGVFTIYFVCIAVATYPGRTEETAEYSPFDSFADR